MPAPFAARGIIITVSVLAAAALAAYENELIRAWIDGARQRIAIGLHTLGDEIQPKSPASNKKNDASMNEEKGDAAEERRRQARADILERGRILEERRKRRKLASNAAAAAAAAASSSHSFDSLVDDDGRLRSASLGEKSAAATAATAATAAAEATATAIEPVQPVGTVRSRHNIPIEADLQQSASVSVTAGQSFETAYEREMRTSWNLPLPPPRSFDAPSSHASESLLDLTPTTEDFADPDYSLPSLPPQRTGHANYFPASLPDSAPQYYYAHPSRPLEPIEPRQQTSVPPASTTLSSAPSIAGSTDLLHPSEADISEDDLLSEPDGIRTPASAWTDVESTVSADR